MINITKDIIEKALDNDIISIIKSKGIKLRKSGKEYKSLCPFHKEKNPSFFVNPEKKVYHCFGCNAKGNLITFLIDYEKLTFIEAIRYLLEQNGNNHLIKNEELKIKNEKQKTSHIAHSTSHILNRVMEFYHRTFINTPEAISYLSKTRKITNSEIYNKFKIGYADGSLLKILTKNDNLKTELKKLGLITKFNKELFKGSIVFPILDKNGNCVNMYGRKLINNEELKIKNTGKQTSRIEHSASHTSQVKHLYLPGKHRGVFNCNAVKRDKQIILSESIIDALSGISNGYTNIIPVYGINGLTDDHINLFKENLTEQIIFAFDNDKQQKKINKVNNAIDNIINRLEHLPLSFKKINLPDKDLNEFFKINNNGQFQKLIDKAELIKNTEHRVQNTEYQIKINGNEILYTTQNAEYTIRGLNLYGFSRMKVNIRARHNTEFHIDTIDLYANRSRTGFINQVSKRFNYDTDIIENDIFQLIKCLEKIREDKIKSEKNKHKIQIPKMTDNQKKSALNFLMNKNLIQEIIKDIKIIGYVGEETNKAIGYLVGVSRKLSEPLSCIIISRSGAGKSALMDKIECLTPPEDVMPFSNITPQALYYMEPNELSHKLLIIEERTGSELADYSIRELQSKKVLRKGVPVKDPASGKIRTIKLEVHGPIAYMESTTNYNINPENTNRCFILHIDESEAQTKRIQEAQRKSKTIESLKYKLQIPEIIEKHHNAQRLLKPVKVFNPFSKLIEFPTDRLRTRRDHYKFLNLIEAVTFLYQYQRGIQKIIDQETGEIIQYVESTVEDYKIAYNLIKTILNTTLDELPKNSRDLFYMINEFVKLKSKKKKKPIYKTTFTRREILEHTKWSYDQIRRHIKMLLKLEYISAEKGQQGQKYQYKINTNISDPEDVTQFIPTPENISKKMKFI